VLVGPALEALIRKEAARVAGLASVYLFGSASRNGGQVPADIDLEDAPLDLLHRVLTEGQRIWDAAPVYRSRFEPVAVSVAIDFLAWRRPYVKEWLLRVSRGR
jgi:hypothetical protein